MRYPSNIDCIYRIDIIDSLTPQVYDLNEEDKLKMAIAKNFDPKGAG